MKFIGCFDFVSTVCRMGYIILHRAPLNVCCHLNPTNVLKNQIFWRAYIVPKQLSKSQLNLTTQFELDMKMPLHLYHPHTHHTNPTQQHLSCYCQNPNPTSTQPNPTYVWVLHENDFTPQPPTGNSMSAISQLLLARFWPNFKGRFLGPSLTDSNCHVTFVQATFVLATFVHIRNISAITDPILTKL